MIGKLRAGERRKLARNLRENVTSRQIGVLGAMLFRAVAPVLLVLGFATLSYYLNSHHAAGVLLAATPVVGVPVARDFLEVMEAGDKLEPSLAPRRKFIEKFDEKLARFIDLIANKSGMTSHKRVFLMHEAEGTSDFPILFGTVLERQLLAKYQIQKPDWRTYVKTGTQNDFRKANLIGVYGLQSNLALVKERGEYKAGSLADGKVENVLVKYGRKFPLTWEALINDDLGAFSDIAERLANAALRTEYFQSTKLIAASTGPSTALYGAPITHPVDGLSVTNKATAAFSADSLAAGITAMRQQKDQDGEPILIEGFDLVVPPALELSAMKVLSPGSLIAVGFGNAASVTTGDNILARLNITPHTNPYLPIIDTTHGNTAWYLFAKLSSGAAVQMNFLRGHESPEIVQKISNKVSLGGGPVSPMEGDFESDSMEWRVRHILGGTQIDPRYTYASDGTA